MKKKYTKILSLLIITLVALMGCSSKNTESINDSNEITIVTSFIVGNIVSYLYIKVKNVSVNKEETIHPKDIA